MTPLDHFVPFVLPYANGASDLAARNAIREAAIDFCKNTKVWRDWLDKLSISSGNRLIDLDAPQSAEINDVLAVSLDGYPLDPETEDALIRACVTPDSVGRPLFYNRDEPTVLRLTPIPTQNYTQTLRVRCSFIPTRTANELPDRLFKEYAREIASGALALLHTQDEEWAKPEKASDHAAMFGSAKDLTKYKVAKTDVRSPRRTRAQYF